MPIAQYGQPSLSGPPQANQYTQGGPTQFNQPQYAPQFNQNQPANAPQQPQAPDQASSSQAASQSRIDPDAIPNPIDVMQVNSAKSSGIFRTNEPGALPPLVTTEFECRDEGNCNPRFIRSTCYSVPMNTDLVKHSKVPIALSCTPFAKLKANSGETEPPISNLGELGPVRCKRCKAYMSPHMVFIESGRRFTCPYCDDTTNVADAFFNHLDHTGRRVDTYERAELCMGSFEYAATKDYCKNALLPNAPAFIFLIDVSVHSVRSGLLQLICAQIKSEILPNLPRESNAPTGAESDIHVGFITYDKELHFYNLKASLTTPQMMVVSDLEEVFVPILEGFLVRPGESEAVIDVLLEQLPKMFADNKETDILLGPAIEAGIEALVASRRPGKLFVFHTNLPTANVQGHLKSRDDRKLMGTDKEKGAFVPQSEYYALLGKKCVEAGCGVDLFLAPNQYVDVATISEMTRKCGGQIYKYDFFMAGSHGDRLMQDLRQAVANSVAFDVVMKVRTSSGIRAVDFLGNFNLTGNNDIEMGACSRYSAFSVELKHDDKLNENAKVFVQLACLFTSVSGQRRIRVHNLCLNVSAQYNGLYPSLELDTTVNYMAKLACRSVTQSTPKSIHDNVIQQTAAMLACYRKNCANSATRGQFILPETLKLMPLFINSVLKSDVLSGAKTVTVDERAWLMYRLMSMDVASSFAFFYPRLISLHDMDEPVELKQIRCSYERLKDDGIYLLENGLVMYLWLGQNVSPVTLQNLFGTSSLQQINIEKGTLVEIDTPISRVVRSVIKMVNDQRDSTLKFVIVRQRDSLETFFRNYLVEDKNMNANGLSYVDFLYQMHHEIRNMLN